MYIIFGSLVFNLFSCLVFYFCLKNFNFFFVLGIENEELSVGESIKERSASAANPKKDRERKKKKEHILEKKKAQKERKKKVQ